MKLEDESEATKFADVVRHNRQGRSLIRTDGGGMGNDCDKEGEDGLCLCTYALKH